MQDGKLELIMLASDLSARRKFDAADLIYQFATPEMAAHSFRMEPLQRAQIYRDQTKHYQMQQKWVQSLSSINSAFLILGTAAKIDGTNFHVLMAEINSQFDNVCRHLLVADNRPPSWYGEIVALKNKAMLHLASTSTNPEACSDELAFGKTRSGAKTTNYVSSAMEGRPKTTSNVFKPIDVAATSIRADQKPRAMDGKPRREQFSRKCNAFEKLSEMGSPQ
ncbi:hypothetical protein L207DRAFT_532656 [Hyaloscypha variabilis F]|uniref:Uncharacterized protein n=1 Tax=Hyaloscypha variabilis (strain UAMH 11265 / GT02V1 / F) TaxID=1149755 RepID=A0A2J6RF05_HYAVF|nr:hypothetical protein L207DRAFT_532656 [Hyaloscypha variabilis F]